MRYTVHHETRYSYSRPVFLEPHLVRLTPRSDGAQRLEDFQMQIQPAAAGQTAGLDADDNAVVWTWFNGLTDSLTVTTQATVVTRRDNPFDYVLSAEATALPMVYSPADAARLAPCLHRPRHAADDADDAVAAFARNLAGDTPGDPAAFLTQLTHAVHRHMRIEIRDYGPPMAPAETFASQCGACRDAATLFIDACRSVGIAARFVSGYEEGDPGQVRRDLHAWAEVYLPGAGWRGYDPTLGLVVAQRHIPIATSADATGAMPVVGTFRGTGATSQLSFRISLNAADEPAQQQGQWQG